MMCPGRCWGATEGRCKSDFRRVFSEYCVRGTVLNDKIYNYIVGPNELIVTGTMKNWERWADLPRIRTNTLVIGAKYDEMSPEDLRKMAESTPNARAWISENST